jgi:hypothetical protein
MLTTRYFLQEYNQIADISGVKSLRMVHAPEYAKIKGWFLRLWHRS